MAPYLRLSCYTVAGMILGVILMHPFAMLAYTLDPQHPHGSMDIYLWGRQLWGAFRGAMLTMATTFALMGGVAGFSLGAWSIQRERLIAVQLESQRRLAALETTKELMITLAHYIRNANVVIGGFSGRLLKSIAETEAQEQLGLVQKASREIEAVIATLENLTEVSTTQYTNSGRELMIDLRQALESRLADAHNSKPRQES
jgi:signal transduction histidine kinase